MKGKKKKKEEKVLYSKCSPILEPDTAKSNG